MRAYELWKRLNKKYKDFRKIEYEVLEEAYNGKPEANTVYALRALSAMDKETMKPLVFWEGLRALAGVGDVSSDAPLQPMSVPDIVYAAIEYIRIFGPPNNECSKLVAMILLSEGYYATKFKILMPIMRYVRLYSSSIPGLSYKVDNQQFSTVEKGHMEAIDSLVLKRLQNKEKK